MGKGISGSWGREGFYFIFVDTYGSCVISLIDT